MSKKIIIPGWSTGDSSWGVTKPYLDFFSNYGQVEIITPRKGIVEADLLVIPGGMDLNPNKYGEVPGFFTGNIDVYKNYFYEQNLPQYIEAGIPMFGICLGFQSICSYFGSKLTQHMYHPYSSSRSELVHKVYPVLGYDATHGYRTKRGKEDKYFKVNSLHHQAVSQYELGEDLQPLYLDEDGFYVEVVKHRELPIAGVQFHPEELGYDKITDTLVRELLKIED